MRSREVEENHQAPRKGQHLCVRNLPDALTQLGSRHRRELVEHDAVGRSQTVDVAGMQGVRSSGISVGSLVSGQTVTDDVASNRSSRMTSTDRGLPAYACRPRPSRVIPASLVVLVVTKRRDRIDERLIIGVIGTGSRQR